ncbi:hypothetical protein HII12_005455 [Brettanomyces bruxellensis]|uniref:dynamin GTPase n=1 Tax=Dekkera bruxellensis TaxID=5007 RepID=A0A8H6B6V5_DEKBR|nr:hypothetical protein HII12_005455 [Brettanomyces bruxellensis]
MSTLQDLIPVVNKLQDILTSTNLTELDLPILSVIGSQSAGKSSVLENIVGKDFLPRGTGIVTRRPLILQLINIKAGDPLIDRKAGVTTDLDSEPDTETLEEHLRYFSGGNREDSKQPIKEWSEFLHIPGKRFYNFDNVKHEIEKETARVAGKNKGISRIPINLKVYSPNVLNLTMVDLPGLTKIPIGDQPTDIERQITNLVLEYISKPNSIILAVTPANVDLVNSEALKLARQVDPRGDRTIGILSKLDLMDRGTNAIDILTGKVYPLKLGFIGVVNRSQQDIASNKALEDSIDAEKQFFQTHPAYRSISSRCGTAYLAKTLNRILMNHIRDRLPDIKARLNTLIGQAEQNLATYGDQLCVTEENRGTLILQLMTKFSTGFITSIDGTSSEISTKELCGGARIYYVYNEVLGRSLKSINPLQNLSVADIRTAIRNSTGPRPSLFVPELAFDLLVKPQIKLLEAPAHRCVELVYEELMKICHTCGPKELERYPKLRAKLIEVVSELLQERLGPTSKYVQSLIDINRTYINTNNPGFIGAARAMAAVVKERQIRKQHRHQQLGTAQKKVTETLGSGKSGSDYLLSPISSSGRTILGEKSAIDGVRKHTKDTSKPIKTDKDTFLNFFFGKDTSKQDPSPSVDELASSTPDTTTEEMDTGIDTGSFIARDENNVGTLHFHDPTVSLYEEQMDKLSLSLGTIDEREEMECELIRRLIVSYFGIIRQTIQDQVPKAIMFLLVNYCKDSVQNTLVQKLYKESLFEALLYEDENIVQERDKCKKQLELYKSASDVIADVL